MKTILPVTIALLHHLLPMTVHAEDVLKVHGDNETSITVKGGQAIAVSFKVTRELRNVTFAFNSVGIGSKGGIAINKDEIGAKSGFPMTIAGKGFANNEKPGSVLKVDRLRPGRYFVVVWVDQGSVVFAGSGSDVKSVENGATRLVDFYAARREPHAPMSSFKTLLKHGLHFTVRESP